jgi:beta-lactam-binding protein with PASTA domain
MTVAQATAVLTMDSLRLGQVNGQGNGASRIVSQSPKAGSKIKAGMAVDVTLEQAARMFVPDVKGKTVAQASALLKAFSLQLGDVSGPGEGAATSKVVSQSPQAGTPVPLGTAVAVSVEPGPQVATSQAKPAQENQTPVTNAPPQGTTARAAVKPSQAMQAAQAMQMAQTAESAQTVPSDQETQPAMPTQVVVPDLTGSTLAQAEAKLHTAGLPLGTVTTPVKGWKWAGLKVASQDPPAGIPVDNTIPVDLTLKLDLVHVLLVAGALVVVGLLVVVLLVVVLFKMFRKKKSPKPPPQPAPPPPTAAAPPPPPPPPPPPLPPPPPPA